MAVGQEPADAARDFLDDMMRKGRSSFSAPMATALMQALCERKTCSKPLDLGPRKLPVEDVGTLVLPLGVEVGRSVGRSAGRSVGR